MNPDEIKKGQTVYFDGEKHSVIQEYNGSNVKLAHDETGDPIRVNPAFVKRPRTMHVTNLDGVGDGRADKLSSQSITTVGHVLDQGVDGLTDAGIDEGHASDIVDAAEAYVK